MRAGVYIHIPFCKQACHYCDFHFATNLQLKDRMIQAMCKEIASYKNQPSLYQIDTIYLGGGTPSMLEKTDIALLFEAVRDTFSVSDVAEITLEANPDDISEPKAVAWKALGINRLSIGIQSFIQRDLTWMNRAHDANQAKSALEIAQKVGFNNLTIDLIYGIPGSPTHEWESNIAYALNCGVQHVSAYALTVEKGTPLQRLIQKQKMEEPDDGIALEQFDTLVHCMAKAGWEQYEISNFCKDQQYSQHNTSYWQQKPYIGIGPSAHSFIGKMRSWNVRNNRQYIESWEANKPCCEQEELAAKDIFNEMLMTGLRTKWGFDGYEARRQTGYDVFDQFKMELAELNQNGLIEQKAGILYLTPKGKFKADGIASSLFIL